MKSEGKSKYVGKTVQAVDAGDGIVELRFDRSDSRVNKLDRQMVAELGLAVEALASSPGIQGVLLTSAKDSFVVGADIHEFEQMFSMPDKEIREVIRTTNVVFEKLEDLDVPTVALIEGYALGGGLELALSAVYRVLTPTAQVGLPEVKLGLFPGAGGTVRLPRVIGLGEAADWVMNGRPRNAAQALQTGVADIVVEADLLRKAGFLLLRDAIDGKKDWRTHRARKLTALSLSLLQVEEILEPKKAQLAAHAIHEPAATAALSSMEQGVLLERAAAGDIEGRLFAQIAKTQAASSLVQVFHNEQSIRKQLKSTAKSSTKTIQKAAVVGAGVMGGGIAYASIQGGVPVLVKDVQQAQLDTAAKETRKLVERRVKAGRLAPEDAGEVLQKLAFQLDYAGFDTVDFVVEAVVENLSVKRTVLAELESATGSQAILASNTSSLRVDDMASALRRPGNLVGMHFFNPVPLMPLVEIVRGQATSDETVAAAVKYAVTMGKTPIVVKDCPGFLVNRILMAYMRAFLHLVAEGADFTEIDRAMEDFGWPMGPAYLADVIGLDVASHVNDIISSGYPDRMPELAGNAFRLLTEQGRHGQKNGVGFYTYTTGEDRKLVKSAAKDTGELLARIQPSERKRFEQDAIVQRMMLALLVETAHALDDEVVKSPWELDTALLLGIGLPRHLGGACKYADWLGLKRVVELCDAHAHLGKAYQATQGMRLMARAGKRYYQTENQENSA